MGVTPSLIIESRTRAAVSSSKNVKSHAPPSQAATGVVAVAQPSTIEQLAEQSAPRAQPNEPPGSKLKDEDVNIPPTTISPSIPPTPNANHAKKKKVSTPTTPRNHKKKKSTVAPPVEEDVSPSEPVVVVGVFKHAYYPPDGFHGYMVSFILIFFSAQLFPHPFFYFRDFLRRPSWVSLVLQKKPMRGRYPKTNKQKITWGHSVGLLERLFSGYGRPSWRIILGVGAQNKFAFVLFV